MTQFSNQERAEVLTQAIPYIQLHRGKIVVIKYGGNAMTNPELKAQVMEDIILLDAIGVKVVLVHGGGPDINDLLKKLGKKSEFVNGLRVTDKETAEVAQMVLAGKVNKDLVKLILSKGGNAIGISGIDGKLLAADFKDRELGYVGEIVNVDIQIVLDILDKGYIPVISTIASNKDGNTYNINGDTAAGFIAGALNAERLIMLTDIRGVMRDPSDESSLIPELTIAQARELREQGIISGGMVPKVDCCIEALTHGVKKVIIMDGRIPHSILMELLTDEGAGTMFVNDEE